VARLIINFKTDREYEIIINFDNVLYIAPKYEGGYRIVFKDKNEIDLTWKEYDRFSKALQKVLE
jgi:hypothetical protein